MKSKIVGGGNFEIYEDGTIYRFKKDGSKEIPPSQILKIRNSERLIVWAQYQGKQKHYYPHRLIAEAFIPNPENKPYVEIIDKNPYNLSVTNLRWMTNKERINKMKKTRKSKQVVCDKCGHKYDYTRESCPICKSATKKQVAAEERRLKKQKKLEAELGAIPLDELKDNYRSAVELRLEGKTLDEIGNHLGVTRERVRQMILTAKTGGGRTKIPKSILAYNRKINILEEKIKNLKRDRDKLESKLAVKD
ncbi:sigma factor-like helix-turn-helix DNA-binding protein [Enterococcus xiangfangensis]|uniref:Sigma factor-like helix-turn-helix DNA-binding protein n=1 Tax=Enterococcus xiangfangensis TaxID=1296537 RepID=A0ABU3F9E6_9ENTE|nr:sigma factor-like helix-turn-helix DNA-binding protein [Enterococcus xiangfangensis]MDT2759297.1 sigma factor-like helix-turn-helix DNA-binding protein [Enterococcus xiangfangensis]